MHLRKLTYTHDDCWCCAQVKYIILVRPSALMSSMLVLLRPFTSIKAARKIRKVRIPEQCRCCCLMVEHPA